MRINLRGLAAAMVCAQMAFVAGTLAAPIVWDNLPETPHWREDVNGDGRASLADALALMLLLSRGSTDSRGDYDRDGRLTLSDLLALVRNLASGNLHEQESVPGAWRVLGPGGGGSIYIPTVDPFDPAHVFARCDMTGSYVTVDGGESWRMFNLRTVVSDFEFDPSAAGTVYASNNGLFRSEDGGRRWSLIYPNPSNVLSERMVNDHADQSFLTVDGKPDRPIDQVLVDPADSRRMFLAQPTAYIISLANSPVRAGSDVLITVSEDRGANWRELGKVKGKEIRALFPGSWWNRPLEVTVVTESSMARVSAVDGSVTYLTLPDTPILKADGGKGMSGAIIYLLTDVRYSNNTLLGGMYSSADGGLTWQSQNSDLYKGFASTFKVPQSSTFGVCRSTPSTVYLACAYYADAAGTGDFGMWKTVDGGKTWSWVLRMNAGQVLTRNFSQSWIERNYDQTWPGSPFGVAVGPSDPEVCFATDMARAFRTVDGGKTWQQVYSRDNADGSNTSRGLDVTTCYGVHFDPFDSLHAFVSMTDVGLFQTRDGGRGWLHALDGVPDDWINTCYWVEFDPAVQGQAWSVWSDCHDLPRPKMLRSGRINQGQYHGGAAVTTDGGRNWKVSGSGLPSSAVCTHLLLDPSSPAGRRVLYVCAFGLGVFKSSDNGATWFNASSGISGNRNAWRLTRLPDGTLYLLVARGLVSGQPVNGALYRSTDGAASWTKMSLPSGLLFPNDLIYEPTDPRRMYLSCWPWSDAGVSPAVERGGGLLLTEDGGSTWRQVLDDNAHVYAAALDPANPACVIVNTFESGAFRSDNRGSTWRRLKGYTFKWGHRPVFDPHHSGMLYLTTFGGGLHYGPAAGTDGETEDIENFSDSWRWGN